MNKVILLIGLLLVLFRTATAQITVTVNPVTGFHLNKTDLLNCTVFNSGATPVQVSLKIQLYTNNNVKVIEGTSPSFTLATGANVLTHAIVNPVYNITSSSFPLDASGMIPFGKYNLCVTVYKDPGNEELASACEIMESIVLSPPVLVYPQHQQDIYELNPVLTWIPPTPSGSAFQYDLKVVEILPGQNAYDAIQKNFAMINVSNITTTSFPYPVNATPLVYFKNYAWQVIAKSNNEVVGETEVWVFRPVTEEITEKRTPEPESYYVVPDAEPNKKEVEVTNKLRIVSKELTHTTTLDYTITDAEGKIVPLEDVTVFSEGNGRFVLTFLEDKQMKDRRFYFTVKTPKGRFRHVTFIYRKK